MLQFAEISILISKSEFRFRLFSDEIEITTKFHTDFVEIPMSKSEFQFRHRNFDSDLDFGIRLWYKISIQMTKFQSIFHRNMSKNSILIIYRNFYFDRQNRNSDYFRKFRPIISSKVISVGIQIEIPAKSISVETPRPIL
jgi:hypothetical protein